MPFKSNIPDVFIPDNVTLPDFMVERLQKYPNSKLLVDPYTKREYSSHEVIETIKKVSAGFYKLGLKVGDVVAIALPNMVEYPILLFGLQNIGIIPTVFNPMQTVEELSHQLKDSGAIYFVTIPLLLNKVNEVLQQAKGKVKVITIGEAPGTILFSDIINNNGQFPRVQFDTRTTVALVPYSSGTTGLPKGVELTHYNIVANILQTDAMNAGTFAERETWITFLPFFHIYGLASIVFTAMKLGHTLVVMSKFDKLVYFQSIQEYKASILPVVPPVVLLLAKDPTVANYNTSSARIFFCAAAPLGADLEADFLKRFPDVSILQGYGMTELSPCSHMQAKRFAKVPGSVGPLCPNMTLKIIDTDTGKELGVRQRGEVWVRGPNIMKGYRNNPKATNDTIDSEGYLHTGDIGYVDADGNMFIVDRLKELIKYKGFQVAPAELESLLLTHPEVADVAVIGKPDLEAGELPMAFVVRKKDAKITAKDLIEWAEKTTSNYKRLRGGVVFMDAIPKSEAGKILRKLLRAKL